MCQSSLSVQLLIFLNVLRVLFVALKPVVAYCLLLVVCYLLPVAYCLLSVACCLLSVACYLLPVALKSGDC
jgi:hypothetical protein